MSGCADIGYDGGELACLADCQFDRSACYVCGDGVVNPGEECDDEALVGADCASQGHPGGTLACGRDCTYDVADCSVCGDGVVGDGELCDDGGWLSRDGCDSACGVEELRWNQLYPALSPGGRSGSGFAYDAVRDRMVLFGGSAGGQYLNDTWNFDGQDWTEDTGWPKPPTRRSPAMAFDAARGVATLFSGVGSQYRDDTWIYDGQWTQLSVASHPSARWEAPMVYDVARRVMVLQGGSTSAGAVTNTWEFDGTDWTGRTLLTNPNHVLSSSLGYHAAAGRVFRFGGTGISLNNYFWQYDGTDWAPATSTTPKPGACSMAGFAYDSLRRRMVLYGGFSGTVTPFDDIWELVYYSALPLEICDNGVDDDTDGRADCVDPDCTGLPCAGGVCQAGLCQ